MTLQINATGPEAHIELEPPKHAIEFNLNFDVAGPYAERFASLLEHERNALVEDLKLEVEGAFRKLLDAK